MKMKSLKKVFAVALSAVMVFGSVAPVLAANSDGSVSVDGTGQYEGGPMEYPVLSVTLPTIANGTFDYKADPNDLIGQTNAARYNTAGTTTFSGDTGVYFLTSAGTYTNNSATSTVENNNAQDVDFTVKLEEKTPGSDGIEYASSSTFTGSDAELYLAIVETGGSDAALDSSGAVSLTKTVAGSPDNYYASYDSSKANNGNNGYGYVQSSGTLSWNSFGFKLTGALNKNATWKAGLGFPEITVTWSFKEHKDTVDGFAKVVPYSGANYLALRPDENTSFDANATSVIVNNVDVTNKAQLLAGYVAVKAADLTAAGIQVAGGVALNATYVVNGTTYTATYTP